MVSDIHFKICLSGSLKGGNMNENNFDNTPQQRERQYIEIQGDKIYTRYKGFYISRAAADDTRPLNDNFKYAFRVPNSNPKFIQEMLTARKLPVVIDVYTKIARWACIGVLIFSGVLFFQEKNKPYSNVFLTTISGQTYQLEAHTTIKETLNSRIRKEPLPQNGEIGQ